MSDVSISQFDRRFVNQQRQINDRVFRLHSSFDSSKYLTNQIWQGQISPVAKKLQHWSWFLCIIYHFISESHQKNLWALPYFCLGCLLKSATVTSFSQLHLSRNSCSRRSLDKINLHFLAFYTRWLIKKGKKCEKLSKFFVGMENFTFREMHVGEKLIGKS